MTVTAKTDVEQALHTKKAVEAIQDEQNDIASSELSDEQAIEPQPPKQTGEPQEAPEEDVEPQLSDREQKAQDLLAQRRQQRDAQIQQDEQLIEQEEEPEEEPEFDNNANPDVNLEQPGIYGDKILLKVDGKLVQMDAEKALSILQKNESADSRLEQASQRSRDLDAREQQLNQRELALQHTQPPSPGVDTKAEVQTEVRKAVELLEDGETDQAVELLTGAISRQNPTATAAQVAQQVKAQLARESADATEARLKESGKYDDVFKDDKAYQMALQNAASLNKQGFKGSVEDLIVESIEQVRDWRSGKTRQERLSQTSQDDKTSRQRRKASAPKSVSSAQKASRPAVVQKQEPSPREKRAQLMQSVRAARNQA